MKYSTGPEKRMTRVGSWKVEGKLLGGLESAWLMRLTVEKGITCRQDSQESVWKSQQYSNTITRDNSRTRAFTAGGGAKET